MNNITEKQAKFHQGAGDFYESTHPAQKRHLKFAWEGEDCTAFGLQGEAVRGFSSLCLRASLWASEGRKEDGEKDEDSSRGFIVRQKIIMEKAKSLLQTVAKNENRIFPSKCKATTGGLEDVSYSNVKISV